MATLGTKYSLLDWAKNMDPQGKQAKIIEMLMQRNEMLQDIPFVAGNLPNGHEITARAGLPDVFFRSANKGTAASKTREIQFTEQTALLEARQEIDIVVANRGGDPAGFRASKMPAFAEALSQKLATTLVYGNAGLHQDQFSGFNIRMSSTTAGNGSNVILGGGAGADNASVLLVVWGEGLITGIVPKDGKAGLEHRDLGEMDLFDGSNNRYRGYADLWNWNVGLAVEDWRYMVRLANIDISNLVGNVNAVNMSDRLDDMIWSLPGGYKGLQAGRAVFYMNRTVMKMFGRQNKQNVQIGGGLTFDNVDGMPSVSYKGVPVRIMDAMLETESVVS